MSFPTDPLVSLQGSVIYLRLKSACAGTRAMLLPLYVGELRPRIAPWRGWIWSIQFATHCSHNSSSLPGDVEAKALESHLMRALPSRPLTHDLASSLLRSVGCRCASARVTHIKANTYYATLEVAPPEGSFFFVDSRPSDALNMAVRLGAPIYISEELMRTHGVSEEEGGAPRLPSLPPVAQTAPVSKRLDGTLELRMRIALAVAQGRSADAQKLREEVEEALAKGPHALGSYGGRSLAELAGRAMVDLELAVKEERWADAAAAGATLAALDEELGPRSG